MSRSRDPARSYDAFLFDMDGTLVNSMAVIERVWTGWAHRFGYEPEVLLKMIHGVRAFDVISALGLPAVDPEAEARALLAQEMEDVDGIVEIPGAAAFLNAIPAGRWAIVTSAPIALAERRLAAAGIAKPPVIVGGEDVAIGKPNPEGYLLGAGRLGVDPACCLVFEDAVAGILAGEAAGADVVVVTTTHAAAFETPHRSIAGYHGLTAPLDANGRLMLSADRSYC